MKARQLIEDEDIKDEILVRGQVPRIRIAYEVVTEESAGHGDAAERGWWDEEGVLMQLDDWDVADGLTVADVAIKYLKDEVGNLEASSSHFHPGVWYTMAADDYGQNSYSYFPTDFTPEEEQKIFNALR